MSSLRWYLHQPESHELGFVTMTDRRTDRDPNIWPQVHLDLTMMVMHLPIPTPLNKIPTGFFLHFHQNTQFHLHLKMCTVCTKRIWYDSIRNNINNSINKNNNQIQIHVLIFTSSVLVSVFVNGSSAGGRITITSEHCTVQTVCTITITITITIFIFRNYIVIESAGGRITITSEHCTVFAH